MALPQREPGAAPAIVRVRHLTTAFRTPQGLLTAVDDVGFDLHLGEILGLVGESGCGKTVTARSLLRLLPARTTCHGPQSAVWFGERDLMQLSERAMRRVRGRDLAMIFQEPMTALNPVFRVGRQIEEGLKLHTALNRRARRRRAIALLAQVDVPDPARCVDAFPHQLSGGMQQRVLIAIALGCAPRVLIADEPTTALDVTVQAQILALLDELRRQTQMATLLVTHDLGVVAQICDRVVVMYAGRVVEVAPVADLFERPQHPYTQALIDAIPRLERTRRGPLRNIPGRVPSPQRLPTGCRFAARCPMRRARCAAVEPELRPAGAGRRVRCHFPLADQPP